MIVLCEKPLSKYSIDLKALALIIVSFIGNVKLETGHNGWLL